jgi:hypothetical protein
MAPDPQTAGPKSILRGPTSLIIVLVLVVIVLLAFPTSRWFLAISVGIGVVVAAILYLWPKYKPVTAEDQHSKHPLGLG